MNIEQCVCVMRLRVCLLTEIKCYKSAIRIRIIRIRIKPYGPLLLKFSLVLTNLGFYHLVISFQSHINRMLIYFLSTSRSPKDIQK